MNRFEVITEINNPLVGNSEGMRDLRRRADEAREANIPVLIEGEPGVGKETLARWMHLRSGRSGATFVTVSCCQSDVSAFDRLVPAAADTEADEGSTFSPETLFLDEVGNLDQERQARVIRMLDRGLLRGARMVCATTVPLRAKVTAGTCRSDLYEAMSGCTLFVPPLRERRVDIPLLTLSFLKHYGHVHKCAVSPVSRDLMELFLLADWPGNVRELESTIERYVREESEEPIIADFRNRTSARMWYTTQPLSLKALRREAIRDCDCKAILVSLNRSNWNRRRAAQELQISYRLLLNVMKDLRLPAKRRSTTPAEYKSA